MLKPIGTMHHADSNGFLPRTGVAPTSAHATLLEQAVHDILGQDLPKLTSILVRGSAARDDVDWVIADYDFVLLFEQENVPQVHFTPNSLQGKDVEFLCLPRTDFLSHPRYASLRAFLSFCHWPIWGEDIAQLLPAPKLDANMLAHLPRMGAWFDDWQADLASCETSQSRKEFCQWMMKRIVRTLFESVAVEHGVYSRDIYPCARFCSDLWPEWESRIMEAAELAVFPTADPAQIDRTTSCLKPLLMERYNTLACI